MHYILDFSFEDVKNDMWFNGTIYNQKQEVVEEIFDDGLQLNESDIHAPFIIILDEKESNIKNKKLKDKIHASVIRSGFLFLVSSVAKDFFESLKLDNMQFFDVAIKSSDFELNDYKVVNITDKIDCADFSASTLKLYDDGDIKRIKKLVLDETKIPEGKKIFLLGRRATGIIIVHDSLKKAVEEAKLTGFKFIELNKAG